MKVRIQKENFSIEDEVKELKKASLKIGAIVTFVGSARDFNNDGVVCHLEFEEYENMAKKALKDIRERAFNDYNIIDARIIHRIAKIEPGEDIVFIAVASERRKDAFKSCSWIIDELKRTVPIWKKEVTKDSSKWVSHP